MHIGKSIVLALLAGAAGYVLFPHPLPPEAGRPLPDANAVIVQYWEKWNGNEAAQMQSVVDDFNRTAGKFDQNGKPRATPIFVHFLSMSDIEHKTLIATAAGSPPDVAGLYQDQIALYAAVDALQPLDAPAAERGLTADYYKKVYWDICHYEGKLFALPSTPAATALHYNKRIFAENAANLRAAGLDPGRPPRTISELDAYAKVLDAKDEAGKMTRCGFLPREPAGFTHEDVFWFGGEIYDEPSRRLQLTGPKFEECMNWIASYSRRLGADAITRFHAGLGDFDSPQNPFMTGQIVMEQQGPWMANFILHRNPEMINPAWKGLDFTTMEKFEPQRAQKILADYMALPLAQRKELSQWAAAPFPSSDDSGFAPNEPGGFCGLDTLCIPSTAKHKKEAFEFIAYINRMDVMEKICGLQYKNTPLTRHSDRWLQDHPNAYIDVFDAIAASPNARSVPHLPVWPQLSDELKGAIQEVSLLKTTPEDALAALQERMQKRVDVFYQRQAQRTQGKQAEASGTGMDH